MASFNNEPGDTPDHLTHYYLFERAIRFGELMAARGDAKLMENTLSDETGKTLWNEQLRQSYLPGKIDPDQPPGPVRPLPEPPLRRHGPDVGRRAAGSHAFYLL